jgi:cytochrome c oxidase cbb3-type subunit III
VFVQNCAFCHGRDAAGGETGPDLTRSKLVQEDKGGNQIGPVVRNGRTEKGMPRFSFSESDLASVVAFVHTKTDEAAKQVGGRRGVEPEDLTSGNAKEGERYFQGTGGCASCHSPTGDLKGVATRYQGLKLEERMLYPKNAKATALVTLANGQQVEGVMEYRDEFTIALTDKDGWHRSWPVDRVKYSVKEPAEAHVELLAKYTDDDIHNLMAYLQTLR